MPPDIFSKAVPPARPIRILHVLNSLNAGGLENGVVNVANSLEGGQFEFHFACLDAPGTFVSRLKKPRVTGLGRGNGFSIRATWRLARLLRRVKPDIVHTHNLGPLLYTVLASGLRRPVILHGEHSELSDADLAGKRLWQRRILYRRCAMLHAVSLEQQQMLAGHHLADVEVRAIINGVDTERFCPGDKLAAREQPGLPPDSQVVGLAGRFAPQKRHADFLAALELLAAHPRLHALIVGGGGPLEGSIHEMAARHPMAARIHLTGFQQNMVPFLQAMDLLVIPSENEGMSNVMLEAMACGVPVLANVVCGAREVITDGSDGWVRDLSSPALIAAAVECALADERGRDEAALRARETAVDRFALASMTSAYRTVYSRLATRRPA
jgi:glycosyltransferase involved in cell wall biosynthesis